MDNVMRQASAAPRRTFDSDVVSCEQSNRSIIALDAVDSFRSVFNDVQIAVLHISTLTPRGLRRGGRTDQ